MSLRRLAPRRHAAERLDGCGAGSAGTLPRARQQLGLTRSSSLEDSSVPQRNIVALVKEDKETFGFEIQTTRFLHQNDYSLELYTCVCKIQEESPAYLSGLQIGDILANVNGVSIDGFSHKQIVDLIKSSGNYLRLETINEALLIRKLQLETKLQLLKQALQQRCTELRALHLQEQRLLHGALKDTEPLPWDGACWDGHAPPVPALPRGPRCSSESSSRSRLSWMTLDSEDGSWACGAFEDSAAESLSRQSSTDEDCVFPLDGPVSVRSSSLRRHHSTSVASSGSLSPLWEGTGPSYHFGTLPRKSRRPSVRKQLLKFIPGLHRAVEEEESRV